MGNDKSITINFAGCKYLGEVHEKIGDAFGLSEWYGQNWSAFHDILRGECDAEIINIVGLNDLPNEFDEQIQIMKDILSYEQNYRRDHNEKFVVNYIDA